MAGLVLRNVNKRFGDAPVLSDIEFEVADGEFAVFVGPSGCGKSTLLRAIAGLETVDSGSIRIGEREVVDLAPAERGVAMVFQSYALFPHMSVYENMAFGLKIAGRAPAEIDKAVRGVAETLGLAAMLDRKPRALSGGERQRVAIGRAIVRRPAIFLFDEPLSNLDAALRVRMRREFARLHGELATTMVYVTHDQVEAMTLADRIVVLRQGRVEQQGAPATLYERPANRFVAGFIGSPAMNFIQGEIVEKAPDRLSVRLRSGRVVPARVDGSRATLGAPASLGVRPEHLSLEPRDGAAILPASVELAEPLGAQNYYYLLSGDLDEPLIMQTAPQMRFAKGAGLELTLAPEHLHCFDGDGMAFPRL